MKRRAFILSLIPLLAGLACKKQPTIYDPEGFKDKIEPPEISGHFVLTEGIPPSYIKPGKKIHLKGVKNET